MTRTRITNVVVMAFAAAMVLAWRALAPAMAAPPTNDDFDSAQVISSLPFSETRDTTEATTAPDDPFFCGRDATVWYSLTPSQASRIEVSTSGSSYSTFVSVYTGARGSLSAIACGFTQLSFSVTAGTTYYILVAGGPGGYPGPGGGMGGTLVFSMQVILPPPNDDFDNATPISALPFTETLDTRGATTASDDPFPSCGGRDATVWYTFTPSDNLRVEANNLGSNFSPAISVYTGSRSALTPIACGSQVFFSASAGQTYFLMVAGFGGGGTLTLLAQVLPPPPNDNFADSFEISSLPFTSSQDISGATVENNDPFPTCGGRDVTVWYRYTATQTSRLEADTTGTNYFAGVSVYTGNQGSLVEIACNSPSVSLTRLRFDVIAGNTYFIMIGAGLPSVSPENLQFSLSELPPAPPNDDFDNASSIASLPFSDSLNTRGASVATDDPSPFCSGWREATIWYSFIPEQTMRVDANTFGSGFLTSLSVYTGQRGALNQIACGLSDVSFTADGGTTYFIMISAYSLGGPLLFAAQGTILVPPANDDIDAAVSIRALPFEDRVDARGATTAGDDPFPFCGGRQASIWYSFTPTENLRLEASTGASSYPTTLSVYTGERGSLTQMACASFGFFPPTPLRFDVVANVTYFFMISGSPFGSPSSGTGGEAVFFLGLAPPPPSNDDFDSAAVISDLPFSDGLNTRGATIASDDPFPFCSGVRDASVWYSFSPPQNMRVEANTFGSNYGTTLSVYTGSRGALNQLACGFSQVSFSAETGTTYFIMVTASSFFGGAGGDLILNVQGFLPPGNDDFNNATPINAFPFTDNVDTSGATTASDDPFPFCAGARDASVWYALKPTMAVVINANTFGSSYSAIISVYTGSRGALTQTACGVSQLSFVASAGTQYFIMVSGFGSGGSLVFSAHVAPIVAAPSGVLFGTDAASGNLLTIDPSTGAGTLIGPMGTGVIPALAIDPTTGLMYAGRGGGQPNLYLVDPVGGAATLIGSTGLGFAAIGAMDFRADGTLYAAVNIVGDGGSGSDHLAVIDKASGATTVIGPFGACADVSIPSFGGGSCSLDGMEAIAFDSAGMLWGALSARGRAGDPGLYRIDPATGIATFVASILDDTGSSPSGGVVSLQFARGMLYGGTATAVFPGNDGGRLITIDPTTGRFAFVGSVSATGGRSLGALAFLAETVCPVVLDNFNRPNGGLGRNWRGERSGYRVVNHQVDVRAGGPIYWQSEPFGPDQSACVTLTTIDPDSRHHTLMLKIQRRNDWSRGVILVSYNAALGKVVVEVRNVTRERWVRVGSFTPRTQASDGDQLGARALADGRVEVYHNNTLIGTASAGRFYSGKGGYLGLWFSEADDAVLDDFGGGTISP